MNTYTKTFAQLISDNRVVLMGFSMICIMLYHQQWFQGNPFFQWMNLLGYLGVEVFLLLSGFGIAHSLQNNSLSVFYKNRVVRLLPVCFVAGLIKICFSLVPGMPETSPSIIWDLTGIANWYVYAILVYYLISPLLFKAINKWGGEKKFMLCIILLSYTTMIFWKQDPDSYFLIYFGRWIVKRLPVYVLGMLIAQRPLNTKPVVYCTIGVVFMILNIAALRYIIIANANPEVTSIPVRYFTYLPNTNDVPDNGKYLLDMLSVFFLCPLFALMGSALKKMHIDSLIGFLGIYSLELYVTHQYIFEAYLMNCSMPDIVVFLLSIITSLLSAYTIHWIAMPLTKLLKKI